MANAEQTAQGLASLGRYGDSMMVHMNPNEVAGLQQLAEVNGTTLTINPDTGMPEAFLGDFISSLLPTIAAAGVTAAFPGAAPFVAPMVGAGTTILQGKTDPLEIAMGGLSGYGGGQIGSALTAPGTVLAGTGDVAASQASQQVLDQAGKRAVSNVMGANLSPGVTVTGGALDTTSKLNQLTNAAKFDRFGSPINKIPGVGNSYVDPSRLNNPMGTSFNLTEKVTELGPLEPPGFQPGVKDFSNMQVQPQPSYMDSSTTAVSNNFGSVNPNLDTNIGGANLNQGIKTGFNAVPENLQKAGQGIVGAAREPLSFFEKVGGGEYVDAAGNIVNKGGEGSALYGGLKVAAPIAMAGVEGYYSDMYDGMNTPITRGGPSGPLNLSDAFRPSMTLPMYARGGIVNGYAEGGDTSKPALNLNNVKPNYTAGSLNLNTGSNTPPEEAVVNAIVSAGQNVGGSTNQPFSVPTKFIAGQGNVPQDYRGGIAPNYTQDIAGNFRSIYAQGGMIPSYQAGGIAGLGYGGLLEGEGDGISDSIPARIDGSQEAALSKGEFVVPARIVSEIGNGSSDAGAERLYAMMDRVEKDRERTTGQGNIAVDTNAERRLPA